MSDYDLINGEILTVTVTVDEETVIANINTAARGPAGPAGGGSSSITSATTSDGTAALYLDSIRFEATNGGPTQLGEMAWESTDGSIDAMLESDVIVAMGEDLVIRVRNTTASPITKGTALAYDGTSGASGRIEVKPWVGANIPTVKLFMGFAACDIPANSNGYSQWFGKLAEINTSGGAQTWLDEQIIYAVPGASATLTNVAPTSGEYAAAAVVINAGSGTSGILFVRPTFESITSLISLGAGTTGAELFGAATVAAARTTLGIRTFTKPSDESRSSATTGSTYTVDSHLKDIPLAAGKSYKIEFYVPAYVPVTEGGKVRLLLPLSSRVTVPIMNGGVSVTNWGNGSGGLISTSTVGAPAGMRYFTLQAAAGHNQNRAISGVAYTDVLASTGNLSLEWAQNTSGVNATILLAGSQIIVTEL
jgi:hypothetical protein